MVTDGRNGPDRIVLEGLQFYGFHGVNPEERVLGQRFQVDVALDVDLSAAASSDDIRDTVSYSAVFKVVRRVIEGEPRNLLESVAGAICTSIFAEFPRVSGIAVDLRKPNPPMRGAVLSSVGVRLERIRTEEG